MPSHCHISSVPPDLMYSLSSAFECRQHTGLVHEILAYNISYNFKRDVIEELDSIYESAGVSLRESNRIVCQLAMDWLENEADEDDRNFLRLSSIRAVSHQISRLVREAAKSSINSLRNNGQMDVLNNDSRRDGLNALLESGMIRHISSASDKNIKSEEDLFQMPVITRSLIGECGAKEDFFTDMIQAISFIREKPIDCVAAFERQRLNFEAYEQRQSGRVQSIRDALADANPVKSIDLERAVRLFDPNSCKSMFAVRRELKTATRKAIKKSSQLFINILGEETLRVFLSGEPFVIEGKHFDFKFVRRKGVSIYDKSSPVCTNFHIPFDFYLVCKESKEQLASICAIINDTPVLDMIVAFALYIRSGNEEELLKRGNFFGISKNIRDAKNYDKLCETLSKDIGLGYSRAQAIGGRAELDVLPVSREDALLEQLMPLYQARLAEILGLSEGAFNELLSCDFSVDQGFEDHMRRISDVSADSRGIEFVESPDMGFVELTEYDIHFVDVIENSIGRFLTETA